MRALTSPVSPLCLRLDVVLVQQPLLFPEWRECREGSHLNTRCNTGERSVCLGARQIKDAPPPPALLHSHSCVCLGI